MYGRLDQGTGCLANLTDGGEGSFNLSRETRLSISAALKRKGIRPPSRKGCRMPEEFKKSLSHRLKGHRPWMPTQEWRQRHRARMLGTSYHQGHRHSEEAKQKMREARLRNPRPRDEMGRFI